jgi:hypothetical protein
MLAQETLKAKNPVQHYAGQDLYVAQESNYLSPCCCFRARGMVTVATGEEGLVKIT